MPYVRRKNADVVKGNGNYVGIFIETGPEECVMMGYGESNTGLNPIVQQL